MNKKRLILSLAVTSIIMGSITFNAFADSNLSNTSNPITIKHNTIHHPDPIKGKITKTFEIMNLVPPDFADKLVVKVNRIGESTSNKYSDYKIKSEVTGNRVDFTVVTGKGTSLGCLKNSMSMIDEEIDFGNGIKEYRFHYTFFNYSPMREININVTSLDDLNNTEENQVVDVDSV